MSYIDTQRLRMLAGHTNIKGIYADTTKSIITSTFKNSPSYYPVTVNTPSSPYISTPLDAQIVDDPTKTKEVKQITLIPNQTLNYGDLISWLGDYWLTTTVDYMGGMYYRGSMQKCLSSLKWKDSTNNPREAYFAVTTAAMRGLGIVDGKEIILPDERRFITIQNNVDTLKIAKNQRFIFDNGRCWKVVSFDSLPTGVINLELQETELSSELDNTTLRICNYYAHSYSISIVNGASASLLVNSFLPLNVVVKDKGNVVTLPVTYTSLNTTIATVSSTGMITTKAIGTVSVKAALTSDPSVSTTISIVVSASIANNYTLQINGSDSLKLTSSSSFSGIVKNNGAVDGTKTVTFSLFAADGVSATTLASIVSQDGANVTLKANSKAKGDIVLKATCNQDGSIVASKVIHVVSLY